ncbi:MAG: hypothetical protein ACYSR3_02740, partial [Planctomycetota bacterium]
GTDLTDGFRAVEGIEPIKLPDSIAVVDLKRRYNNTSTSTSAAEDGTYVEISTEAEMAQTRVLRDTTSFSIIFSPSGKLIVHDVRVRNKDGKIISDQSTYKSLDTVFNTLTRLTGYYRPMAGTFVQDDYAWLGLGQEPSRRSFIIYEKEKLQEAYQQNEALIYLQELQNSEEIYINPYTGTMISEQK